MFNKRGVAVSAILIAILVVAAGAFVAQKYLTKEEGIVQFAEVADNGFYPIYRFYNSNGDHAFTARRLNISNQIIIFPSDALQQDGSIKVCYETPDNCPRTLLPRGNLLYSDGSQTGYQYEGIIGYATRPWDCIDNKQYVRPYKKGNDFAYVPFENRDILVNEEYAKADEYPAFCAMLSSGARRVPIYVVKGGNDYALAVGQPGLDEFVTKEGYTKVNTVSMYVFKSCGPADIEDICEGSAKDGLCKIVCHCGDNKCEYGENNNTCPGDCGYCGDGIKQTPNGANVNEECDPAASPTGCDSGKSCNSNCQCVTPLQNNFAPIGNLDGVNCGDANTPISVGGWACDNDSSDYQIRVDIYADAPAISSGSGQASGSSGDPNDENAIKIICGSTTGAHRYLIPVTISPTWYLLRDGAPHNYYAYGINIDSGGNVGGGNPSLTGSPYSKTCDPVCGDGYCLGSGTDVINTCCIDCGCSGGKTCVSGVCQALKVCGDNKIDPGEACDGNQFLLGNDNCSDAGYDVGSISCIMSGPNKCTVDWSECCYSNCSDSDNGPNFTQAGFVTLIGGRKAIDYCGSEIYLGEVDCANQRPNCEGSLPSWANGGNCPQDMFCETQLSGAAACVPSFMNASSQKDPWCIDSDLGINPWANGTVSLVNNPWSSEIQEDYCADNMLYEFYCSKAYDNPMWFRDFITIYCDNCKDGKCIGPIQSIGNLDVSEGINQTVCDEITAYSCPSGMPSSQCSQQFRLYAYPDNMGCFAFLNETSGCDEGQTYCMGNCTDLGSVCAECSYDARYICANMSCSDTQCLAQVCGDGKVTGTEGCDVNESVGCDVAGGQMCKADCSGCIIAPFVCGNGICEYNATSGESEYDYCPADCADNLCPEGKTMCLIGGKFVCRDNCGNSYLCDNNRICELGEGCDCPDCANMQDTCQNGLICIDDLCQEPPGPPCGLGLTYCNLTNDCRATCINMSGIFTGFCNNNGTCDPGEGCENSTGGICLDCWFQQDTCDNELACSFTQQGAPVNTSESTCQDACGNGILNAPEQCDGTRINNGNNSCTNFSSSFNGGLLSCNDDCSLNTDECTGEGWDCGNGQIGAGETCDINYSISPPTIKYGDWATCRAWGFDYGNLGCDENCQVNTSQCIPYKDLPQLTWQSRRRIIMSAPIESTVFLVYDYMNLRSGVNVMFEIFRRNDTGGDEPVRVGANNLSNMSVTRRASVAWTIDSHDLRNVSGLDNFYFVVNGNRSGFLRVVPRPISLPVGCQDYDSQGICESDPIGAYRTDIQSSSLGCGTTSGDITTVCQCAWGSGRCGLSARKINVTTGDLISSCTTVAIPKGQCIDGLQDFELRVIAGDANCGGLVTLPCGMAIAELPFISIFGIIVGIAAGIIIYIIILKRRQHVFK